MADPFAPAELELRIALLPPISRGAHLDGPRRRAEDLAELWCADGAVSLAQAFRLLDVPAIAGVLLRASVEIESPDQSRYWMFPDFEALLPALRELAWQEMLAGRLIVEAVPVKGSRHGALRPVELPDLEVDWPPSRLLRAGQCAFVEVQVQPMTMVAAPARKWRKRPSATELENAMKAIAEEYPTRDTPRFEEIWEKLDKTFPGITREVARNALTAFAKKPGMSWLKGRRGYGGKRKPPK